MAQSPFSLIFLRRLSLFSKTPPKPSHLLCVIFSITSKPFCTSPQPTPFPDSPKPSSLSARMSFVFDQIDLIEKQKREKFLQSDETLQRIRSWRQSRKESEETQQESDPTSQNQDSGTSTSGANYGDDTLQRIRAWRQSSNSLNIQEAESETAQNNFRLSNSTEAVTELGEAYSGEFWAKKGREVELVHPWPEWIELMERLVQQNYFDHKRRDEEKMVQDLGFEADNAKQEVSDDMGIDFKNFKTVQAACVNFGKDRFDILRSLSRQDIQILVGHGCPSADKKVVFSAKLLRKRVHLNEGDVCSSCSLRNSCERAYLITNKEDEARTIDVMRVLLTYGFDPYTGSVVNKSLLKQKPVKTVVRKLLHEVVKLSAVPIDPNLPPPIIKKPPPKVKQPPPPPKKRVGRDDVEMKKGDWLCPKCDFMNFAKNTVCLQCDAKRPKRQLLPGEWECPECNFLNYRRNMACFHCDCKRPPDTFMENKIQEMQRGPRTRLEKVARRPEVSNAWNFDFDDDESDGADVAAFENADSPVNGDNSLVSGTHDMKFRGPEDDFSKAGQRPRVHERDYSDLDSSRPGTGFDDFDDEDDIDSYEIDTQRNNSVQKASLNYLSEADEFSEPEGIEDSRNGSSGQRRTRSSPYSKPSKSHRKADFSNSELDFDSDGELPVHPNWKSSHVANSRHRSTGGRVSSRGLSFGSDEELDFDSDVDDDFGSRQRKGNKRTYGQRNFQMAGTSDVDDEFESDGLHSSRNRSRNNKIGSGKRGNNFTGYAEGNFGKDMRFRSKMGDRRNYLNDNFDRSRKGSHNDNRRFKEHDHGGWRKNGKGGGLQDFKGPKRGEGFGSRPRGRSKAYDMDDDPSEFANSRRVIER